MVSQRARDRGKKNKAAVAGRLTKRSNPEIIAALAYCIRQFKAGGWTPGEAISAHYKTLDLRMRDAVRCAKWMLRVHANKETGRYYMRRHPGVELEKFGLRWVDWSRLNPDLCPDKTILAFELEHQDLWLRVKSFLLGQDVCSIEGSYTPWRESTQTELLTKESSNPFVAGLQVEIRDKLNHSDFVTGLQTKVAQNGGLKQPAKNGTVREKNGCKYFMTINGSGASGKHILGVPLHTSFGNGSLVEKDPC